MSEWDCYVISIEPSLQDICLIN